MSTISQATVISVKAYGRDIREYLLQLKKNYYYEAGSFLQLTLEKREDYSRWPSESRNFSIASMYHPEGKIKLIIRKVGYYTGRIFDELKIGSDCTVKYAFGDFLLPFFDKTANVCCIASGTGIAPILAFCEQMKREGRENQMQVFYSFKTKEEYIGKEVLEAIVPKRQLHLYCTRENLPGTENRRMAFKDLEGNLEEKQSTHYYICGGESFTESFRKELEKEGCENIYTDEW